MMIAARAVSEGEPARAGTALSGSASKIVEVQAALILPPPDSSRHRATRDYFHVCRQGSSGSGGPAWRSRRRRSPARGPHGGRAGTRPISPLAVRGGEIASVVVLHHQDPG